MRRTETGLLDRAMDEIPVAVIDFETTGLAPGPDRVVEASVVRMEPGGRPRLVFDTLVNPGRPVGATWIHGISDHDVTDAPRFDQIAGAFQSALAGCLILAYNVNFDMRFMEFELGRAGVACHPPYACLMFLRPMLGLGERCKLDAACSAHGIRLGHAHRASADALAAAQLWGHCLHGAARRGLRTFRELVPLGRYKFLQSFDRAPLAAAEPDLFAEAVSLKSRTPDFG